MRGLRGLTAPRALERALAVEDGRATVRVCWGETRTGTAYPIGELAPDLDAAIARARAWAREIVEAEWNSRTPIEFTGWDDCAGAPADVELVLIDSSQAPSCGDAGTSCVEALGTDLAGGTVYLNLLFGEEILYASRYQQSHRGASYVAEDDLAAAIIPQACLDELRYGWSLGDVLPSRPVDIEDPAVRAEYMAVYETCAKNLVLHEFGHIAGFAHEQLREDDPAVESCRARIVERGLAQDWIDPGERYLGDAPLSVFDAESIMSYCRTDPSARLTATDVEAAALAYAATDPPAPEPECMDGTDGTDGTDATDGIDGMDGTDGTDGDGPSGTDGMDGADGMDGRVAREIDCTTSSCVCEAGELCALLCGSGGCDARCMPGSECIVLGRGGDVRVTCAGAIDCQAYCDGCTVTCDACSETYP